MAKKVVFSGIQPTGDIHLGNYLGAIRNWVSWQDAYENIFCIVNSHAITIRQDPRELREKTLSLACMLLACGISAEKSSLFIQSEIDEHAALAWILDCNISMGEMSRMTQFKDKASRNGANANSVNVGLFNYPALMAADILLYDADLVPVGADQKQHIELARNVAERFNRDFGECFRVPSPMIVENGARIMGLDDPTIKMSKSVKAPNHAVFLLDSNDEIAHKIKKATTDSVGLVAFDPARAGLYNLLCIYEILSGESRGAIEAAFASRGYGDFKAALIERLVAAIAPIREEYLRLQREKDFVAGILRRGAEAVRPQARARYARAKELVGLV